MVLSRTPLSSNLLRPLSTASSSHSLSRGLLRATYLPSSRGLATATEPYDLVVIGGGPGGYVAAIKAAQLGMKVGLPIRVTHMTPSNQAVLVDGVYREEGELGGNVSECRLHPLEIHVRYNHLLGNVTLSKWSVARLNNSQLYHQAKHDFKSRGIDVGDLKLNLPAMMAAKTNAVKSLTGGIETYLFKKNGIDYIKGAASFASPTQINVALNDGGETQVEAKNVIIATGSEVTPFPGIEIDEKRIVSSTGVLELKEVPKKMVVIGGGIIGLELGSVWSRLGSEVTVVEYLGAVGAGMDAEVGKQFQKILQKQGLKFKLNTKVLGAEQGNETIKLKVEAAKGGKEETLEADVVLVSIGRRPVTKNLGLENIGVETDKKGRIVIDDQFNTSAKGVKCIGDVTFGPMLAHKAEEEAIAAVEIIKSGHGHVNYDAIPSVVYTHPEVAWVGKNEEELKAAGVKYKIGKYPFAANSRAKTNQDTDGFVKFIVEKDTDQVLGCHIIGPNAGEMIASAVLAMEYKASAEDIARTSHAHPTLSEAFKEAAMASYGQAINY